MSTPASVPTRKASKWSCGRAKVQRRPARVATGRRRETTNSPSGALSSFLCGDSSSSCCTPCGASIADGAVVAIEEVPWGDGKRTLTKAYMLFLARWARRLSWKETAEYAGLLFCQESYMMQALEENQHCDCVLARNLCALSPLLLANRGSHATGRI